MNRIVSLSNSIPKRIVLCNTLKYTNTITTTTTRSYCTKKEQDNNNNNSNSKDKKDVQYKSPFVGNISEPTSYDKMFQDFKKKTSIYEQEYEEQYKRFKKLQEEQQSNKQGYLKTVMANKSALAWAALGLITFALMFRSFGKSKQNKSLVGQVDGHMTSTTNEIEKLKQGLNNIGSLDGINSQELAKKLIESATFNINQQNNNNTQLINQISNTLKSSTSST